MLTLRAEDILRLRSPGGERFAEFVNSLIRAHARAHGIPDAAIRTNLNTTVGDGGVDAEVTTGAGNDATGRMTLATGWQFKATDADQGGPAELRAEIAKPYARQLVAAGASYAFCVCDQLTPQRKDNWEQALRDAALKINPDAAPTQLSDANDIAAWASDYPALAMASRPLVAQSALTLRRWGETATGNTPQYVTSPSLEAATRAVQRHAAFDEQPIDAVLTIRGPVGVGKSRLVYEALKGISGADGLVLYTLDENAAARLAYQLANADGYAILVADECTVRASERLRQLLGGRRHRVRVIAIESTEGEYRREDGDAIWIEEVTDTTLDQILAANFPQVQPERRRAFARLSEGFVRFAVDLCRHDADFQTDQILRPAPFVRTFLRGRLPDVEREVVAAIALVDGIGYKADAAPELDGLATVVGLDARDIKRVVQRSREAPGFAATAGRYLYVKPPIVAQVAFADAWERWGADDPDGFLTRIAEDSVLLKRFLRRVARSASVEVRARVATRLSAWAKALTPISLAVPGDVDRLVTLIEVDPLANLPVLRRLVEQAPPEQLLGDTDVGSERRNVRHQLVRIAGRIAALPECFRDAEAILLRLAIAESDPNLSNNATGTHKQLFQPILSGTRVPFEERLDVLAERLRSDDERVASQALAALGEVFSTTYSRAFDEPLVAGRVAGDDWEPTTTAEHRAGLSRAFALLREAAASHSRVIQTGAWNIAIQKIDMLVRFGFASELATLFPPEAMSPEFRSRVIAGVEWLLARAKRQGDGPARGPVPGEDDLGNLVEVLRPADLHGRLVAAVGIERWRRVAFDREELWREELDALARALVAPLDALAVELDWLCSDDAPAAYDLGVAVGRHDPTGGALACVVEAAQRHPEAPFPRGYVAGFVAINDPPNHQLNEVLDRLEAEAPTVAFNLAASAGDAARALERALRLVDLKTVAPARLGTFAFGVRGPPLTEAELKDALKRLVESAERGEPTAGSVALDFGHRRVAQEVHLPKRQRVLRLALVRELLWRLLASTAENPQGEEYSWSELVEALIPYDSQRAVKLAASALASGSYGQREDASALLAKVAPQHPEPVMAGLGQLFLAERAETAYSFQSHRNIVGALPAPVVQAWIQEHGADGAVAVASHLPRPFQDSDGSTGVPEITVSLLEEFGHHDEVFQEFCRGSLVRGRGDDEDEQGRIISTDLAHAQNIARVAPSLLDHALRPIQEWARWIQREAEGSAMIHASLEEGIAERRFR